ncbi:MAG TPA: alpha/beta fold hydrolase [Anaerolineales bacterium]|nr:alpha/beta fold hydrolase [Anaerolineales bacterium]
MHTQFKFHVGYYDHLHPVPAVNFQMNRWINYLGDSALDELQAIAPKLLDFPSYRREFLALAEKAVAEGRKLPAAYYFRSAEFFMWRDDPAKQPTRQKFLQLVKEYYGIKESDCYTIPYQDGAIRANLFAYRFTNPQPKDTLVVFGGFDSYMEEFLPILLAIRDRGYDVVCFEGPGQGRVLEESGVPMTPDWHKPVKAILDYFNLTNVTLLGISMGGCLVTRAAAQEPRARRIIAYDVLFDMQNMRRSVSPLAYFVLHSLFVLKAASLYNSILRRAMKANLQVDWAVNQGMHIHGAQTPFEYVQKNSAYHTGDISHLLQQDVLLLAGTEDLGIPLEQFYKQIEALKSVRSLTARMFTRAEQAQNHCQIGNLGLAIDFITNWIEFTLQHAA